MYSFRAIGSKPSWVQGLAQALLQREDANVLVVDWIYGGSFAYNIVVDNYKEVALQISVLINQLAVSVVYKTFKVTISLSPENCNSPILSM